MARSHHRNELYAKHIMRGEVTVSLIYQVQFN